MNIRYLTGPLTAALIFVFPFQASLAAGDLSVDRVTVYEKCWGKLNVVKINLKNEGNQVINTPFDVRVYKKLNGALEGRHHDVRVNSTVRPGLGATVFVRDVEFTPTGSGWTVQAVADIQHVLVDADDSNNTGESPRFSINQSNPCPTMPDLTVGKVYFPDPECKQGTNRLRVYVRSLNRVRLSTGIIHVSVNVRGDEQEQILHPLQNGTKWSYFVDFDEVNVDQSGVTDVIVQVDPRDIVSEQNENDNQKSVTLTCDT